MKHIEMTPYIRAATQAQLEIDGLLTLAKDHGGKASMKKLQGGRTEYRLGKDPEIVAIMEPPVSPEPWYQVLMEKTIKDAADEYAAICEGSPITNLTPCVETFVDGDMQDIFSETQPRELTLGVFVEMA